MPEVAIFLNQCLPLSEIFVAHQARAFKTYSPTLLACNKATPSVDTGLPEIILNRCDSPSEKIRELAFKLSGRNRLLQKAVSEADIVHAHFGPAGWLASGLAARDKKPLAVTLHGFDVLKQTVNVRDDGLLHIRYAHNRRALARRATVFICVSQYVKKRAIEFGFPADKCRVEYLGIPLTPPAARRERAAGQPIRLFAAGRLVPFKGHAKLIEAVSLVQKAGYDVQLDIAGDGPLRIALEKQAAISLKNYRFHGAVSYERMMTLMRDSDIFCHSSLETDNGQTEALGLVLLEAQWNGLPVVAFVSGGVSEAVDNGRTGLLSPQGDVRDFCANICRIINNSDLYSQMSKAGPDFIKNNFDSSKQAQKIEILFDEIRGAAR